MIILRILWILIAFGLLVVLAIGLRLFALNLSILVLFSFKSVIARRFVLWLSRSVGRIHYLMKNQWIPPVFWLVVTAVAVWLVGALSQFDSSVFNNNILAWLKSLNPVFLLDSFIRLLSQWPAILLVYTISLLFWWVWRAGRRVVVEEFVDYTGNESTFAVKGLATLLVVRLGQLRDLYQTVDEQRAIPTSVSVYQSIDATINVEDVSDFLKDAVSAQSEFSLGALKIPVGTLMSLIGRIVQGPRILGSVYRENDHLILTAQQYDGKSSRTWRVDRPMPDDQANEQRSNYLTSMVEELACRMFTDLALSGSVRWKATATFCEGLHAYRDCLRTPKARKLNLELAEKKFIETLAEDQKFNMAYYNLGVVYTELGQLDAADIAFENAIEQDPASWNAFYALALNRYQSAKKDIGDIRLKMKRNGNDAKSEEKETHPEAIAKAESVLELCKRVIDLKPDAASIAKAYQLRGLTHELIRQCGQDAKDDQRAEAAKNTKDPFRSHRRAVGQSWRALCAAELGGAVWSSRDSSEIRQLETLASVCLANRAGEYRRDRHKYWKAQVLIEQALDLKHADAEYVALCYFDLGETYHDWGNTFPKGKKREEKFDKAKSAYRRATRIRPENVEYLAALALAYAELEDLETAFDICEEALDHVAEASPEAFEKAFVRMTEVCKAFVSDNKSSGMDSPKLNGMDSPMLHMEEVKRCLEEEREINEQEELLRRGELTVDGYEEGICQGLARHDKDGSIWGYAQYVLALGRLSVNAGRPEKVKQYQKYHEKAKQKLTTSLEAIKIKKDLEKQELHKYGEKHFEWMYGQFSWALGLLYLQLEDLAGAKSGLDKVVRDVAEVETCSPDAVTAEECFRNAIDCLKNHHVDEIRLRNIRAWLSRSLLGQRRPEKYLQALHEVRQALATDSISYFDREVLGDVYFSLKEFEQAIKAWKDALLWRNALLREPDSPDIYYKIGQANMELGRHCSELLRRKAAYKEAVGYLEQALGLYSSDQQKLRGVVCYWLGILHVELGNYWGAISYFRIVQMLGFARLTSTFYLGYAYLKNREYDESKRLFQELCEQVDEQVAAVRKRGQHHEEELLEIIVEAETKEPISLGEFKALACWGQAFAYAERDVNLKEAEELIVEAEGLINVLNKDKSKATKVYYPARYKHCRGWIHFKRGENIQTAISCLEEALALTAHAEIYLHLALVHESCLQETKEAAAVQSTVAKVRTYCQHVRELDFNGEYKQHVVDLLQRLEEKSKEVKELEAQAHKLPGQTNHVHSKVRKSVSGN